MPQKTVPCVVCLENGAIIDVVQIDKKGLQKSRETKTLWSLHKRTGRLLPYAEGTKLFSLHEKSGWAAAVLESSEILEKQPVKEEHSQSADRKPESRENTEEPSESEGFLYDLETLIGSRKESMPEGSYTTHLFSSGPDKIRKKAGEEAVELLLARNRSEIVYESADLLYHVLVLLAAEGIKLEEIISELKKRHG